MYRAPSGLDVLDVETEQDRHMKTVMNGDELLILT